MIKYLLTFISLLTLTTFAGEDISCEIWSGGQDTIMPSEVFEKFEKGEKLSLEDVKQIYVVPSQPQPYPFLGVEEIKEIKWALETLLKHIGPTSTEGLDETIYTKPMSPAEKLRAEANTIEEKDIDIIRARKVLEKLSEIIK